jgi:hypothetical protein
MHAYEVIYNLPRTLEWVQMSMLRRSYELRANDSALIGKLSWMKTAGSLAQAEIKGEAWTFKRTGFFKVQITIRRPDSDYDLAVFKPNWRGTGILEFADGRLFHGQTTGFLSSGFEFADHMGRPLMRITAKPRFLKSGADVSIEPSAEFLEETPLLLTLGWYLCLLAMEDQATVVAVTAAAG